ncbi:MAG: transporter [Magnetospirillum sp.]|nr:transporter [Magnetospirillum sp.]
MKRSTVMGASVAVLLAATAANAASPEPAVLRQEGAAPRKPGWWVQPVAMSSPAVAPLPGERRKRGLVKTQVEREELDAPPPQVAQAQPPGGRADTPPQPEHPGVLTRPGVLIIEPGIEYQHTDVNRFVVGGVAILDTVLVGSIEATQANRDSVTGSLGLRLGLTDRFEGEVRIPYMYRNDRTTNTVVSTNNTAETTDLSDHGLGDIEGAVHWQINDANERWPAFVANLRVKSTTGTGPFDTARNALGIERELATGSGFWGVEPSLTLIAPSDPAVFYANVGYLWNVKDSIDKTVGARTIRDVDPGDAVRLGIGMGLALNEKVSFTVGYQHDWIMGTETEFADGNFKSESLSVGSLSLGVNWQIDDRAALNVSVGIGVTNDSPDVRLMARVPIAVQLF